MRFNSHWNIIFYLRILNHKTNNIATALWFFTMKKVLVSLLTLVAKVLWGLLARSFPTPLCVYPHFPAYHPSPEQILLPTFPTLVKKPFCHPAYLFDCNADLFPHSAQFLVPGQSSVTLCLFSLKTHIFSLSCTALRSLNILTVSLCLGPGIHF